MNGVNDLYRSIDLLLRNSNKDCLIVAIDGRCGAGKSTLAAKLKLKYDCNVFHMDDFFPQAHQRTRERLNAAGENIDHERFYDEVLCALTGGEAVAFRRYDCHSQSMEPPTLMPKKRLNIVEGVYCLHPDLRACYDLKVFAEIDPAAQRERIRQRCTAETAQRFFDEWIPLEERYFDELMIRRCADLILR